VTKDIFDQPVRLGQTDAALAFLHEQKYDVKAALRPKHAQTLSQMTQHFSAGFSTSSWTADEVETLCDGVRRYGDNPRKVANMIDSKSFAEVNAFYHFMYPFAQNRGVWRFVKVYQRAERARWGSPDEEPSEDDSDSDSEEEDSDDGDEQDEDGEAEEGEQAHADDDDDADIVQYMPSSSSAAGSSSSSKKRKNADAHSVGASAGKRTKASPVDDRSNYVATHGHFGRISQPRGTRKKRTNYTSILNKGINQMPSFLADKLKQRPVAIPNPEHTKGGLQAQDFDPDTPLLCVCRRPEDGEEYIHCVEGLVCGGWCHIKCVGLRKKSTEKLTKMTNFVCASCKAKLAEDAGGDGDDP